MITIEGNSTHLCDGVSRRQFMRIGGLGVLGLTLPQLLGARASLAGTASPSASCFGRARRCILLYMWGGPPHHDTFDMKPDATAEVRGEFSPIHTNVPGIFISDNLPLLSQHADKFTIVRSVSHVNTEHKSQCHDMLTGNPYPATSGIITARPTDRPSALRRRSCSFEASQQRLARLRATAVRAPNQPWKDAPGTARGILGQEVRPVSHRRGSK